MITCECKRCGTRFKHSRGPIRCPHCGSRQVWIVGGIGGVILLTVLLAASLAVLGFVALPPETFRAEVLALIAAVAVVCLRFWMWRKPAVK